MADWPSKTKWGSENGIQEAFRKDGLSIDTFWLNHRKDLKNVSYSDVHLLLMDSCFRKELESKEPKPEKEESISQMPKKQSKPRKEEVEAKKKQKFMETVSEHYDLEDDFLEDLFQICTQSSSLEILKEKFSETYEMEEDDDLNDMITILFDTSR